MPHALQDPEGEVKKYLKTLRLELNPGFLIDRIILEHGYWELHVTLYVQLLIQPGWTCVDVGANAGYVTLPMAQKAGPSGKILAFEPNHRVQKKLLRNLELNPEGLAPIELLPFGLGDQPGSARLAEDLGHGLGNATLREAQPEDNDPIEIRTLDSFELEKLHFLKVDVEGMELAVLKGASRSLERHRPYVLFETLTTISPETHKRCEDFLRERDYVCYNLDFKSESLVEVRYPNYPQEDTLALPAEKAKRLLQR